MRTDGTEKDAAAALEALRIMKRDAPAPAPEQAAERKPAGEVAKKWAAALPTETKLKTRIIKEAAVTSFVIHYGPTRAIASATGADVGAWLDALGRGGLATPTLVNKASYLAGFFKFAQSRGWYPKGNNPARGLVAYGPSAKRARRGEGFKPFTPEQIAMLYAPNAVAKLSPGAQWGALLGLHTGARVSEVGQLRLVDFVERDGLPCVRITDEGSGQSVKTDKSDRTVPLHPALIDLGLLNRVAALHAAGETRLFPKAKVGGVNGMGNWLSKAFSYHIQREKVTVEKGRLGFHSLRSTLIQRMQDAKVHAEVRAAIEGHELDDEHHASYSRDITPAEMLDALKKVSFGLDMDGLRAVLKDTTTAE
ncbi:MAG: site-specific integrase [Rhodanobacteraceae bacterium]